MKKLVSLLLLGAAVALFTGCTPSNITNEETSFIPEGATFQEETTMGWTMPETVKYTIPENAETGINGGPGAMETTAVDYSSYPDSKKPGAATPEEANTTLIILYRQTDLGLQQDFDAVDVCDADSLIAALERNGAFKEGTQVKDFSVTDAGEGTLVLSALNIYSVRNEDVVLAGIANTFIENLGLKNLKIMIGDKDCGTFTFTEEY